METGFLPYEAIRRIIKSVGPEVPVLGFAGAPWTLACYVVEGKAKEGFATVKSFLYHEPNTSARFLHRIAQATIPYLKAANRSRCHCHPIVRYLVRRTESPGL